MSEESNVNNQNQLTEVNNTNIMRAGDSCPPEDVPCQVEGRTETEFTDTPVEPVTPCESPIIKVPVLLAETELQIVVESDIPLNPPASEIKRVEKDAIVTQCKLVPVEFEEEPVEGTEDLFRATRAKLFVSGFIRKDIQYATDACNGTLRDRIASVSFSGHADLNNDDFLCCPVFAASTASRSRFIHGKKSSLPRFDKYLFDNNVFYNEQPFCELVRANFVELDFSPCPTDIDETFDTLREKIVLDLTLKVLQKQQVEVNGGSPSNGC